jgi:hypothetical protein
VGTARPAADGQFAIKPQSGPLQLKWQFAALRPMQLTVGPEETCDLGHLANGNCFRLELFVWPNSFAETVTANQRMRVELKAVADNAESPPLCVEISWDGIWSDDTPEMAKHLVLRKVKTLSGA